MFENNIFNIILIEKNVNTKNDAWGKRLYDKLCLQKFSMIN